MFISNGFVVSLLHRSLRSNNSTSRLRFSSIVLISPFSTVKILQILDLNPPKEKETRDLGLEPSLRIKDNAWKVLIYDRSGQRIISPLLKIDELREQGVTVNLLV